jgi:hypothetical protein
MVKEKNQTKIRPSLSTMILIGMGLGIACGIFLGEYCGFLSIIGDAFIQLLQMTILPYIVASLILGIGGLSYKQAKLLALRDGIVMLLFWVFSFINVLLILSMPLLCFAQELEPRRWGHPQELTFSAQVILTPKRTYFLIRYSASRMLKWRCIPGGSSIPAPLSCFKNLHGSILPKATRKDVGMGCSMALPPPSKEVVCPTRFCDLR